MTRQEKIDHICRSFPHMSTFAKNVALHAIGTHTGPMPDGTLIKESLERMDPDALDIFYEETDADGDLLPLPANAGIHRAAEGRPVE